MGGFQGRSSGSKGTRALSLHTFLLLSLIISPLMLFFKNLKGTGQDSYYVNLSMEQPQNNLLALGCWGWGETAPPPTTRIDLFRSSIYWLPQVMVLNENRKGRRGWGSQSATPTPPPRSRASSVGANDLGGGIGVVDWRPRTPNRLGTSDLSPVDSGFGASNRQPRLLHRGRRRPLWASATSVEGSGLPIGGPDPSRSIRGSGLPIGNPNSSTEVGGVLCGCRRPRWRGRGCRLVAPTPPPLSIFVQD
ncbi:hypothetical protein CDL15_Pgr023050 [Punica granatum]|uniref:Uncharacterized protein n=1 Tax=Punica granatum TaxID=22663 RepID=A0A218X4C5_PUNGR|nr:hypothetical protein CDL15_Pgr023050 [Punica granatum]